MWGSHPKIFGIKGCSDQLWIKLMQPCSIYTITCMTRMGYVQGGSRPQSGTFTISCTLGIKHSEWTLKSFYCTHYINNEWAHHLQQHTTHIYGAYCLPGAVHCFEATCSTLPPGISSDRPVYSEHADAYEPLRPTDPISAQYVHTTCSCFA